MDELRDSIILIILITVLSTYQMFGVLTSRTRQLTEDARATRLVADCELWDILPPSQPTKTLVLACPGVNAIRLWPMPVQQAWVEDDTSRSQHNWLLNSPGIWVMLYRVTNTKR